VMISVCMWKEEAGAYLEVLYPHLSPENEDCWSLDRDLGLIIVQHFEQVK
jgi:hypothetical protein